MFIRDPFSSLRDASPAYHEKPNTPNIVGRFYAIYWLFRTFGGVKLCSTLFGACALMLPDSQRKQLLEIYLALSSRARKLNHGGITTVK